MHPAGFAVRCTAFLIGALIHTGLLVGCAAGLGAGGHLGTGLMFIVLFAINWLYQAVFELLPADNVILLDSCLACPMRSLRTIFVGLVVAATVLIGGSVFHMLSGIATDAGGRRAAVKTESLSHGRFKKLTVYSPETPSSFVLLLSGAEGWSAAMAGMATRLAEQGAMVTGIDLPQFNAELEADGGQCVFPDGDLENLSHFVQAYYRLPTYFDPILAGDSEGATLAYATLVQAPKDTFAGAVSLGFCPNYALHKPLCKGSGIEFTPRADHSGVEFLPAKQLGNPWVVLPSEHAQVCKSDTVNRFVAQVPNAQLGTQLAAAIGKITARTGGALPAALPAALRDLPIVFVAAKAAPASDLLAILLSGDGGWAGLDQEVAGALAANGIPVVGLDSLRYFWRARAPDGLAKDIDRMIGYYLTNLGKQNVLLIGYSQGADVLPFAVNRLPPATAARVALTAVMGMSEHALFEFHVSSWISDDNSGPATMPEIGRITGSPVLCIYGEDEGDTLCPKLDPHKAIIVKLKGGHHFDGDYAGLARTILASAHPGGPGGTAR